MLCKNCNTEIDNKSLFCKNCGQKIADKKPNKRKILGFLVCGIITVFFIATIIIQQIQINEFKHSVSQITEQAELYHSWYLTNESIIDEYQKETEKYLKQIDYYKNEIEQYKRRISSLESYADDLYNIIYGIY